MRAFYLERRSDESGVSGTGRVAEGVEFNDGACVLKWNTLISSLAVYDNILDVEAIHGHGGKTLIVFAQEFL